MGGSGTFRIARKRPDPKSRTADQCVGTIGAGEAMVVTPVPFVAAFEEQNAAEVVPTSCAT